MNAHGTLLAASSLLFSLQSYCTRNSSTVFFAIALAEIRTRLILRRKGGLQAVYTLLHLLRRWQQPRQNAFGFHTTVNWIFRNYLIMI